VTPPAHEPDDLRAARRRAARLHHPDLGGDERAFVEEMSRLERVARTGPTGSAPVPAVPDLFVVGTTRGRVARAVRRVRPVLDLLGRRLPAGTPGVRRYGRI
jgi:hypothetical protein